MSTPEDSPFEPSLMTQDEILSVGGNNDPEEEEREARRQQQLKEDEHYRLEVAITDCAGTTGGLTDHF